MSIASRRLESAADNIANLSTPGFKRLASVVTSSAPNSFGAPITLAVSRDESAGALTPTKSALDVAVSGDGYLLVRDGERMLLTRAGRFTRDDDGRLTTAAGYILQDAPGSDLRLDRGDVEILSDGVVLNSGIPASRIGLFNVAGDAAKRAVGGSYFEVAETEIVEARGAALRQGMIEASNVALADEMLAVMAAIRSAETGARLIQTYDSVLGQVFTTFGERR
jgi:flagellar basal-body rod protein FlgG